MRLFGIVFITTSISLCFTLFFVKRFFGVEKKMLTYLLCGIANLICYGVLLYEHMNATEELLNRLAKASVFVALIAMIYVYYVYRLKKKQHMDKHLSFSAMPVLQIFMMGICTLFLLYFFISKDSTIMLEIGMYCMEHLLLFCIIAAVLAMLHCLIEVQHTSASLIRSIKRIRKND
ncbi:MAG: hypothetical protein U0N20_04250 [Clostridium sp.]